MQEFHSIVTHNIPTTFSADWLSQSNINLALKSPTSTPFSKHFKQCCLKTLPTLYSSTVTQNMLNLKPTNLIQKKPPQTHRSPKTHTRVLLTELPLLNSWNPTQETQPLALKLATKTSTRRRIHKPEKIRMQYRIGQPGIEHPSVTSCNTCRRTTAPRTYSLLLKRDLSDWIAKKSWGEESDEQK